MKAKVPYIYERDSFPRQVLHWILKNGLAAWALTCFGLLRQLIHTWFRQRKGGRLRRMGSWGFLNYVKDEELTPQSETQQVGSEQTFFWLSPASPCPRTSHSSLCPKVKETSGRLP